jgi:hypothetical protein
MRMGPILWVAMVLAAAACRSATDHPPFPRVDADRSGAIDWREYRAAHPEASPKAFLGIDADKDGKIVPGEWPGAREESGPAEDGAD